MSGPPPILHQPIGTVMTLTPVFQATGPNSASISRYAIEVRRASDNALFWSYDSGFIPSFRPVTFSKTYSGTPLVSGTTYKWRAWVDESGVIEIGDWSPFVEFTPLLITPPTATPVSPTGGGIVGTLTPTLQFSYSDPGNDAQGAYQIQVRRVSDGVSMWDTGQVSSAATSVVYAGSTLSASVAYEWRVRVADVWGVWGEYSSWASFTPQGVPNAPAVTSPLGLINTITPTIQGTYSQGLGSTEAAFQYEVRQGAVTIYASGDVAVPIATGQAYGTDNSNDTPATPPALAWGITYSIRARSKDANGSYSPWSAWLTFRTNAAPTTPTGLSPTGGAVVSDTTPTLSWTHNDPEGDAQTKAQIELRLASTDAAVTGYDPKELTQSSTTHDVTETLDDSPTDYKWRVRTMGLAGPGYGPWSDWATFTVADAPTVTITSPTPDEEFDAPGPVITWTFTGGSGTQQSYRVRIYESDQVTIAYDSGAQSGTEMSYQAPATALRNGATYYVQVSAADTLAQDGVSSLVRFTTNWEPPDPITGLAVTVQGTDEGELPNAYVTWDESEVSQSEFLYYAVYRRLAGTTAWMRIARLRERSLNYYQDYATGYGTWEYAVTQAQDIGGSEVESDIDAIASATLSFGDLYLHDVRNPGYYIAFPGQSVRIRSTGGVRYVQPYSARAPIAHVGTRRHDVIEITVLDTWDDGQVMVDALRSLLDRQRDDGAVFLLRGPRGLRHYVAIDDPGWEHRPVVVGTQIRLTEVTYPEAVE